MKVKWDDSAAFLVPVRSKTPASPRTLADLIRLSVSPCRKARVLWMVWLLLGSVASVVAHQPSQSYLTVDTTKGSLQARLELAVGDLDFGFDLDANGDHLLTWGELRAHLVELDQYVVDHLSFRSAAGTMPFRIVDHLIDQRADGTFLMMVLDGFRSGKASVPEVDYHLFFELDGRHRCLGRFIDPSGEKAFTLNARNPTFLLAPGARSSDFNTFFREGVWHIWTGYDHVLFLLALLLPAVWIRQAERWVPISRFGPVFTNTLKVVTAFSVAHSITLSLTTLLNLSIPSRVIEPLIAFSVALAAANNLRPWFVEKGWVMAFGFGLVHGFGFASGLQEIGIRESAFLVSLGSFNLGVEGGQLMIVCLFLPVAFILRRSWFYRTITFRAGSAMIAVVALIWMTERALNLSS